MNLILSDYLFWWVVLGKLTVSLYFPVSVTVSCLNVGVQVIRSIIGDRIIVGCGEGITDVLVLHFFLNPVDIT